MCKLLMLRQSFGFSEIKMNVHPAPVFWDEMLTLLMTCTKKIEKKEMKSKHRELAV